MNSRRFLLRCIGLLSILFNLSNVQLSAQTYSDIFNRPQSNDLGAAWVEAENANCPTALQMFNSGTNSGARTTQCLGAFASWNASLPNDQNSKLQYNDVLKDEGRDLGGPAVRISSGGTQSSATLYMAEYDRQNSVVRLWKYVNQSMNGDGTLLGSQSGVTLVTSDWLEIRAQGNTITVLRNSTVLITATDTSIASGAAGMAVRTTNQSGALGWSSWQGGALSNELCSQDVAPHAPPNYFDNPATLPKAQGSSYSSYYCATVTRLSDSTSGNPAWIQAEYATQNHFNSDGTKIFVEAQNHIRIINLSGSNLEDLDGNGGWPVVGTSSEPMWDRGSTGGAANRLWYRTAGGNQLWFVDANPPTPPALPPPPTLKKTFSGYSWVCSKGESDISPDGTKMVFLANTNGSCSNSSAPSLFVYEWNPADLMNDPPAHIAHNIGADTIDWLQITNNYVVVGYNAYATDIHPENPLNCAVGGPSVIVYNLDMAFQRQLSCWAGHEDVGLDSNGNEILVIFNSADPAASPTCTNSVIKFNLGNGTATCLMAGSPALDWSLAIHVAVPSQNSGATWVFLEPYAPADPDPNTAAWKTYTNEVLRVKLDGSGVIQRLAHHYNRRYPPDAYNYTPRASVNGDGTKVLFNSNFGLHYKLNPVPDPSYTDTYMISVQP